MFSLKNIKRRAHNYQPWEKAFDKIVSPFEEFIHLKTSSGIVLMVCSVLAMILANSPLAESYFHVLHTEIRLSIIGTGEIHKTLHHWINDGLMAFFFLLIGLEIKREVIVGELSDIKAAMMPIIAAIGGMIMPALIYTLINQGSDSVNGWGIPMATDIAFAVGLLVMLGKDIPKSVMAFLVGLAIVDDLGAVIVIALFYTEQIYTNWLLLAALFLLILIIFNFWGIRRPLPYFIVGTALWVCMLESGVHATLAGVLMALTIPVTPKFDARLFVDKMRDILAKMQQLQPTDTCKDQKGLCVIHDKQTQALLQTLEDGVHAVESPLHRLEKSLHIPVAFFVIPVFALANAGIPLHLDNFGQTLLHPVTLGIIAGLVGGKLIGVAGFTWLAVKIGVGKLPSGMSNQHLIGVGLLSGIGFTMSIFIAELAFVTSADNLLLAKTGILLASLLAGSIGFAWMKLFAAKCEQEETV